MLNMQLFREFVDLCYLWFCWLWKISRRSCHQALERDTALLLLEIETQCVWDYVGDNYVHRLIQSKTDGKLVELPAPCRDSSEDCSSCEAYSRSAEVDEALYDSKLEAIATEYDHLLTTQLESQRQYYESLLIDAEKRQDVAISLAVEKAMSLKLQRVQQELKKVQEDNLFLQQVNQSLVDNQQRWQQKFKKQEEGERMSIKQRDEQITDLEDQVRDFMVYIEAQKPWRQVQMQLNLGTALFCHYQQVQIDLSDPPNLGAKR